jgi:DNA-binding NarL/FixJ family response regulator
MKILIADDHPLFRDAFKGILNQILEDVDITEMATFSDVMSITTVQQFSFDMVFIDLAMPKGNPYEAIKHLNNLCSTVPIIVVSGEESQEVVKNAIASGAIGFLPKSLDTDSLISNLKHVLSGAMAMVSPAAIQDTDSKTLMADLTARQTEVLELMCEGNTNKMIARTLDLTEGTVKLHVRAILKTLGATNRTQAVAIAKLHEGDI